MNSSENRRVLKGKIELDCLNTIGGLDLLNIRSEILRRFRGEAAI